MFNHIQNLLIILMEVICCFLLFSAFEEKKKEKGIGKICCLAGGIILGVYLLALLFINDLFLKEVGIILIFSGSMKLYWGMNIRKSIVLSALFSGLLLVIDYFILLINSYFFPDTAALEGEAYLMVVLGRVLLFLIVILMRRHMEKEKWDRLDGGHWIRLLAFPLFTIFSIAGLVRVVGFMPDPGQQNLLFLIACGLAGLTMLFVYFLYDMAKRESEIYENRMFRLQVENQIGMYRSISEHFNRQKKKTHEYKNQILCISTLLKKKSYAELEDYVGKISGRLDKELDFICTNHVIVDAVLNSKYQETKENGILFVLKINDLSRLQISDEDIVIILANLLNNAIEACESCQQEKVIRLKFVCEEGNLVLSVRNTCEHELLYQDGEIRTTKQNHPEEHGIGIKNIVETIQKYGGSYVIEKKEGEFYFSIMIPMEEET